MKPIELFIFHKQVLESLFPKDWFVKASDEKHEALQQYKLCNKIIAQGGIIKYPEQANELAVVGKILLDAFLLSTISSSDMGKLIVGALNYGGKKVQRKILQRLPDSQQFQDIMVELYMGAWYITKNNTVVPLEMDGYPDIRINFSNSSDVAYIECKHLRTKDERRIVDVISKGNTQLENTKTDCYGCLVLDVTIPINAGSVKDDLLPLEVSEIIRIVQSSLSGEENKAIGSAVLVWDDYMILGVPPKKTSIAYRRRFQRIDHKNPKKVIPASILLFEGFTMYYSLHWVPR